METAEDTETVTLQIGDFSAELRRQFKAEAARRGLTMQEAAPQAIRNWIADGNHESEADRG